ncbi:MAG: phosphatidylserine decarboxylase family protein [Mailhella sp.]|nr:phosphatidylserine decarboxylase family protein [Mailhella sp.]
MNKPSFALAPEGAPLIGFLTVVSLCCAMLRCLPATVLALTALFFTLHFFRDPARVIPQAPGIAVSPADGRVIKIEEREDPMTGGRRMCISIFMNVFNVHVNRVPVAGVITGINYIPGKYFNASFDKASTDNERCLWLMDEADGTRWTFVQIAGLVARRIVPHAEKGDELRRGQRFGMIRFGSRVDVYLPDSYEPAVHVGSTVLAGQTIIAGKRVTVEV